MQHNRKHRSRPTQICPNDFLQECKKQVIGIRMPFQQMVTEQLKKKKKRFDLNITPEDKTKEKLGS